MFHIPINIPGLERRRRSVGLLHIVAGFFLIANADNVYQALSLKSYLPLVPLYGVAVASLLYGFLRKRIDPASKYNFVLRLLQALTFLSLAMAVIQTGSTGKGIGLFLWVFIAGMLAFTERIALQQQTVSINEQGFSFPSGYTRKRVSWNAVSDLTLRSDFLTIHYPDNRFLQFELKHSLSEAEMNQLQDFCRKQLGKVPVGGQA